MQLASQIAMGRERFWYYQVFYFTALFGLTIGAIRNKNPMTIGPLVPLTCAYFYQRDMLYGDMMERVQKEVDVLVVEEPMKFVLPRHSGIVEREEYLRIMGIEGGKKKI